MDDKDGYDFCDVCDKPVYGYEAQYCCNGRDCACGGRPLEPCICSKDCWNIFRENLHTVKSIQKLTYLLRER